MIRSIGTLSTQPPYTGILFNDILIKMPGESLIVEEWMIPFMGFIYRALNDSEGGLSRRFVYFTVRQTRVQKGYSQWLHKWHVDAMGERPLNYCVAWGEATEFKGYKAGSGEIVCFDGREQHRSPIGKRDYLRTFLRIALSDTEIPCG